MSIQVERDTGERPPLIYVPEFFDILSTVQDEDFPAYLGWSREFSEDTIGYIVQSPGTLRTVAVIERLGENGSEWLSQTFRARKDGDKTTFENVCLEMISETKEYAVDRQYVEAILRQLYVGYGMKLAYPSVILKCNDPSRAESTSDSYSSSVISDNRSDYQSKYEGELSVDMPTVIRGYFEDEHSGEATLALDVGLHMAEMPQLIEQPDDATLVYRSRFHNYSWAFAADGTPLITDFVLLKINDGSIWYVSSVEFSDEINAANLASFKAYENQLINADVPSVVASGLLSRIRSARSSGSPSYLMTDLLKKTESDVLDSKELYNPYDWIDAS